MTSQSRWVRGMELRGGWNFTSIEGSWPDGRALLRSKSNRRSFNFAQDDAAIFHERLCGEGGGGLAGLGGVGGMHEAAAGEAIAGSAPEDSAAGVAGDPTEEAEEVAEGVEQDGAREMALVHGEAADEGRQDH